MKILIVSSTCSNSTYKKICDKRTIKSLDTNQKFFLSIISGLQNNGYTDISCISVLPVSHKTYPDKFIKQYQEVENNVLYYYCKTLNFPIIRNLFASLQVKKLVKYYLKTNKGQEVIILTDGLFYEFSKACKYIHKIGKKVFSIVTDIPDFVSNMGGAKSVKGALLQKYGEKTTHNLKYNYDGYIFLTEQMNEICNPNRRPYIVIEGLLSEHKRIPKKISPYDQLPIVLYAGKYNKEFGSLLLANAASELKGICNIVMYGSGGDCIDELNSLAEENDNLFVNGIIPLEKLLEYETNADLLINPRPDGQEFTKYSFPSKTLEYMDSGTPVLMYKLEGIPEEYNSYLLYISGKTSKDIASSIKIALSMGKNELFNLGLKGQRYVQSNKNCTIQTRKMIDFINYEK